MARLIVAMAVIFGTSQGVDLQSGDPMQDGHRNHLRTINTLRRLGSIRAAVDAASQCPHRCGGYQSSSGDQAH